MSQLNTTLRLSLVLLVLACGLLYPASSPAENGDTEGAQAEIAQSESAQTEAAQTEAVTSESFPGIEEVVPRATELAIKTTEALTTIQISKRQAEIVAQLEKVSTDLEKLETQFKDWDAITDWQANRLQQARSSYLDLQKTHSSLIGQLTEQLQQLDELQETWTEEKAYWSDWRKHLSSYQENLPREVFRKVDTQATELLDKINAASSDLLSRQQKFANDDELIAQRLVQVEAALVALRQDAFRRSGYPYYSIDFYSQFNRELFDTLLSNIRTSFSLPAHFFDRNGWVIALQLIATLVIFNLLRKRRDQGAPVTEEWQFLVKNPLAGALFIGMASLVPFYKNVPPIWLWLIKVTSAYAAAKLLVAITGKSRIRRIIRSLAVLYVVSATLIALGFPRPLLQLYNVTLCLLLIPICWSVAKRQLSDNKGRLDWVSVALLGGSLTGVIGLISELFGYSTLAANLIDAVIATLMVGVITRIAIHISDGGVRSFFNLHWVKDRTFVQRLGPETIRRVRNLFRVIIFINVIPSLLVAWNLFETLEETWTSLAGLGFSIGDFSLSLQMVLLVWLVLYLSSLTSWVIQAMADTHYMTPRDMALGVKAAMKRLMHYGLMLIGFLVAISMAGLELEKFTILAGAFGVGIGFGLQNIVNNFVSGLILLFERPVKVGDTISLDDQWGTISAIGMRSTVVETLDRSEVIVPNADLISNKVTNWTYTTNVSRVILPVGVAYGSDLTQVLSILDTVGREHPNVLNHPEPNAIFTGFGDSSIDFELRVWIGDINRRLIVRSELGQAIDKKFREAGIVIPFPQRDLHLCSIDNRLQPLFGGGPSPTGEAVVNDHVTDTKDAPNELR